MYFRRSSALKYIILAFILCGLYCEWLVYLFQPLHWLNLECPNNNSSCTKILFIADPQIQGDNAILPPLNFLFNWDSDRYLIQTFTVVNGYFKPDVLVFLGDLMDEGSIATMRQYHGYVKRLSHIFEVDHSIMQIWIPGDNDIGGENEPIKIDKVAAFEEVFNQPSIVPIPLKNITFYKVNAITHKFPHFPHMDNSFKIVVSHYPVTDGFIFGKKVNKEIHPDIYFCAHDHDSKYVKHNRNLSNKVTTSYEPGEKELDIQFNKDNMLYEIYVPTCSYRMGTSKIGYGAAVFDNKHLRYTVFWSSKRFPFLFIYLAFLLVLLLFICIFYSARLFKIFTHRLHK